jgi:predicted phosphohydrolase
MVVNYQSQSKKQKKSCTKLADAHGAQSWCSMQVDLSRINDNDEKIFLKEQTSHEKKSPKILFLLC